MCGNLILDQDGQKIAVFVHRPFSYFFTLIRMSMFSTLGHISARLCGVSKIGWEQLFLINLYYFRDLVLN